MWSKSASSVEICAVPRWPSVALISASPSPAILSRVERPTATAARLCSTSPVTLEVSGDESVHRHAILRVKVAACHEVLGQDAPFVQGPSLEGGDELALVDQSVL